MADEIQQIKERLNLVEFIGQYVKLKPAGRNWRGLCPFHADTNPSFYVNPERQFYYCFGCQRGGDIFNFLMEKEGLEFSEALKVLAQRAGVELGLRAGSKGDRKANEELIRINERVSRFYQHLLKEHPLAEEARKYLKKRGVNWEMVERFELGYAPKSWDVVGRALLDKGFSLEKLVRSGLVVKKDNGEWFDRFRHRLVFPIRDHLGRVVGFSARALKTGGSGQSDVAKYLNTPETPVYHKGRLLYGLYQARDALRRLDYLILVEGTLDVISLHQKGIFNVAAPLGTGLTPEQIDLIKRFTRRVLLLFDSDEAGEKATLRAVELGLQKGLEMKVAKLSQGKDPDEAVRQNFLRFKQDLKGAQRVFDYLFSLGEERFDLTQTHGKRSFNEFVLPFLARVENQVEKEDYLCRVADKLMLSRDSIRLELAKVEERLSQGGSRRVSQELERTNPKEARPRSELISEYLIAMLLQIPETLFKDAQLIEVAEEVKSKYFPAKKRQEFYRIWQVLLEELKTQDRLRQRELDQKLENEAQRSLINLLSLMDLGKIAEEEELFLNTFEESVRELKHLWVREQMEKVTSRIREAEKKGDQERVRVLKLKFKELTRELS